MAVHPPTPARAEGRAGAGIRLPWWALTLPVLAFAALLVLISDPAQAREAGAEPAIGVFLEYLTLLLLR
ncbi:hypothetical protein GCM10010232_24030 [Streptomyces amakusaensis]|uniref:Uncharacterized protein n=2 Tax=Streptomyces TaxID=1883 RepID=A0A918QGJ5_9ACTN|nr:hypothetical protein [Streptomyces inusitatus]GGZ44321.1 hypothetical protein GCM10010387_43380 [Streptomyces inusitatus]